MIKVFLIHLVIIFLSISTVTTVQGQDDSERWEDQIISENSNSSMWGQIGSQILPGFSVTNEDFKYPEKAMKNKIQGQVDVTWRADKNGNIIDSTIHILTSLSPELDSSAVEMLKKAKPRQRWTLNPNTVYITTLVFRITEKNWADYYFDVGRRAKRKGNYQKAIHNFNLSIEFYSKEAIYHYALYKVYHELDDMEKACNCLKKAKRFNKGFKSEYKDICK